jgi:DNA ligase (NAD+)
MFNPSDQKAFFDLSKAYLNQDNSVTQRPAAEQIDELRNLIEFHEWKYYIQNDPVVSDYEYDQLYKQLEALEAAHPGLVKPTSPTQRVSSDLTSDFESVEHLNPMLSLGNSYNADDLNEWDAQLKRLLNMDPDTEIAYTVEPKYDGGSIALIYEKDELVRAATRGNGIMGEEITNNARVIRSIPLRAAFSKLGIYRVELRGEVLIRKDRFEQINQQREEEGLSLFANARNTATGGLRMKDPREVSQRNLEAFRFWADFWPKPSNSATCS